MTTIEFKQLIEEKKSYVIERHTYYKLLEESGQLHNNDKDFSTYVTFSKADLDLSYADDLDELINHLIEFRTNLSNVSGMYGFNTDIEIYANDDYVERSHVNAKWYYVRELTDEFVEKTAIKMAKAILSEAIKPRDYDLKAREIDFQLIPLFINGSITIDALRDLTYSIELCEY